MNYSLKQLRVFVAIARPVIRTFGHRYGPAACSTPRRQSPRAVPIHRPRKPSIITESLQVTFGLEQLRPGQREVILSVLAGEDTLALMPTGSGKSLPYQLAAMLLPRPTVVLSPLIALIKDQLDKLPPAVAARATVVNSSLPAEETERRLAELAASRVSLLLAAPAAHAATALAAIESEGAAHLASWRGKLESEGARVRTHMAAGRPADAILQAARELDASIIAMSTHGRSGLQRWMMGSVTEDVLRRSDIPVLVARSNRPEPKGGAPARHS